MNVTMDRRAIAANYTVGTAECSAGALVYIIDTNPGNGSERVEILARSRGHRWIQKWEAIKRLGNFRFKTIPPGHPMYDRPIGKAPAWHFTECTLDGLLRAADRHREPL